MATSCDQGPSGRSMPPRSRRWSAAITAIRSACSASMTPADGAGRPHLPAAGRPGLADRSANPADATASCRASTPMACSSASCRTARRRSPIACASRSAATLVEIDDPYRFPPILGELDAYLIAEGKHLRLYEKLGAHPMAAGGRRRRRLPGLGAECAARLGGRQLQRLGRPAPSHAQAGRVRRVGAVRPRDRPRRGLQVRDQGAANGELLPLKADPLAFAAERPPRTASVVHGLGDPAWDDDGWMRHARRDQRPQRSDLDLRMPSRLLDARARGRQSLPHLRRARRPARALRRGDGLHPSRAAADLGVPVRRLLGLSADRPVRADQPPRRSRGVRPLRRPLPPERHRPPARLGAGALPDRPARPRRASTARISTSTPIRGSASTTTGTP